MISKSSSSAKILSDVTVHTQPHALVRPARSAGVSISSQTNVSADLSDATKNISSSPSTERTIEEVHVLAYRDGFSRGMEEGRTAGKSAGFEIGLKEGREAGEQFGKEEAIKRHQQQLLRFEKITQGLSEEALRRLTLAEDDMVSIVFETICRIAGELAATQEGVRQSVAKAIEECGSRSLLTVRLNHDDYVWMRDDEELVAMLARVSNARNVRIIPDEQVKYGGCIIETEQGSLDARLDMQLKKIGEVLLQVRQERFRQNDSGEKSC